MPKKRKEEKIMKKFIALIASAALMMSAITAFAYPDCNSEAVKELSLMGVVSGDENGKFRPDDLLTRAEFATMVSIAAGVNETLKDSDLPRESQFSDVGTGYWGFKYITYSANNKFIDGFEDGTFKPDENVTYAQAVKICLSAIGYNIMVDQNAQTSAWYEPWLEVAREHKLIDTAESDPNRNITREESAELVYKTVNMPLCVVREFDLSAGKVDFRLCDGTADENGEVMPLETLATKYFG